MAEFGVSPLAGMNSSLGIAKDVSSGLSALHACGIVHGDLKFENILIFKQADGTFLAKVSDFGLASEALESYASVSLESLCKVDVFAFGLLFARLMAKGQDIFGDYRHNDLMKVDGSNDVYDLEGIFQLKQGGNCMIEHAKNFIRAHNEISNMKLLTLLCVVEKTVHTNPELRSPIDEVNQLISMCAETEPAYYAIEPLPLLFDGDPASNELPETIWKWNKDLMIRAAPDIIDDLLMRSLEDMNSSDVIQNREGSYRLFNLARWTLSGDLGPFPKETCLEWFLEAAEMGNLEARSTVFNIYSALELPFLNEKWPSLEEWLVESCVKDEHPGQHTLKELFPHQVSESLKILQDIYCGYSQDCFGEEWRGEFPLESSQEFLETVLQSDIGINDLHDRHDLACSMTWLHYAASSGRIDTASRFEVASYLCPLTQHRASVDPSTLELHFLDRFEENVIPEIARILTSWGADLISNDSDLSQLPVLYILNRNSFNALEAIRTLFSLSANPLMSTVLKYIPEEQVVEVKVEALWFLLELEYYESLIRGRRGFVQKATEVLDFLIDEQVLLGVERRTHQPVLIVAYGRSSLEIIRILLELRPETNINEFRLSFKEYHTPLLAAIVRNCPWVVGFLLESSADPTMKLPGNDWTPLFYSVVSSPENVNLLVKAIEAKDSYESAVSYVNIRDSAGVTAFDTAVIGEFYESADVLLRYKPEFLAFTLRYSEGSPILLNFLGHVSYMADQLEYLLKLLKDSLAGLLIDNNSTTLIHAAVGVTIERTTEDEVSRILNMVLSRFHSPKHANICTNEGDTPLHYASCFCNLLALHKLDEVFGDEIDWLATNAEGWTALDKVESRELRDYTFLGKLARERHDRRTKATMDFLASKGVWRSGKGLI
ncbi:hypothetical protein V496_00100 [Pseudogymnoascus sp. VKM F-4515 (FW-2607)]|nr:hypothetical protein V496_00100 [Pseudogymnoascus sp. VKM F-4515 (FW-2607)]